MPNLEKSVFVSGWAVLTLDQLQKEAATEIRSLIKFLPFLQCFGKLLHLQLLLSVHSHFCPSPFPGREHCFSLYGSCTSPTMSERRWSDHSVLATTWMLGPIGDFCKRPFSRFGVEEGYWGLKSCSWVMGLVSQSRMGECRTHQTSATGDTHKQWTVLSEPCKWLNGSQMVPPLWSCKTKIKA